MNEKKDEKADRLRSSLGSRNSPGENTFEKNKNLISNLKGEMETEMQEVAKPHSITIFPSYVEKMRNIVHYKKMNGEPYFTHGMMIQEAVQMYINSLGVDIPERPEEVKRAEKRRTGRKTKKKTDDLNFD